MSTPTAAPLVARGRRVVELDGLRFVLVIAILFTHAGIGQGGWPAVDTFFMLSGFLIAGLRIDDAGRPRALRTFLGRRFRRLLPAFLVCVMTVSGLLLLQVVSVPGPPELPLREGFWSVLYVGNWYEITSGAGYWAQFVRSPFGHLWSLSIEEQFYLLFPVVMIATRRWSLSARTWVLGVLAALSAGWAITLAVQGAAIDRIYYGTDTRAFSLLLGATAALVTARPRVSGWLHAHGRGVTAVGVAMFTALVVINCTVPGGSRSLYYGGLQATTVVECLLVVSIAVGNPVLSPMLKWAPMVWLGERSYGIYLWHLPVFAFMPDGAHHPWRTLLIGSPIAFGLGALSSTLIEQPFMRNAPRPAQPTAARRPRALAMASVGATFALAAFGLAWAIPRAAQPRDTLKVDTATPPPVIDGRALSPTVAFADATPTTLPPVQHLMVLGDSMAVTFANTLQIPGMEIINNAAIGCGSLTVDFGRLDNQWLPRTDRCKQWRNRTWAVPLPRADATLWMWGAWDLYDVKVNGRELNVGTPEYRDFLVGELQRATDELTAGGKRLFITSALCFPDNRIVDMYGRSRTQNAIIRDFVRTHPAVTYLPLNDFLCNGPTAVKVNGTDPRPDGVHFSIETSKLVWAWLLPYLRGTKAAGVPDDSKIGETAARQ